MLLGPGVPLEIHSKKKNPAIYLQVDAPTRSFVSEAPTPDQIVHPYCIHFLSINKDTRKLDTKHHSAPILWYGLFLDTSLIHRRGFIHR